MKKLFYPAVFTVEDDGGYSIYFPDIQGCNSCGDSLEHANEMAKDALGLMLIDMKENNEAFPEPSTPENIEVEKGQFLVVVEFDMLEYLKKHETTTVKKTLSIPSYLNELGLEANINFSKVLQESLQKILQTRINP